MRRRFSTCGLAAIVSLMAATPVLAELRVDFRESAPKDRFTLENTSDCAFGPIDVTLDLSSAKGGLIFDTTASGAGVEVFQPFEWVMGEEYTTAVSSVTDGQSSLRLSLSGLAPKSKLAFTIDVDDTLTNSTNGQIRVTGSEIEGANVRVEGVLTGGQGDNTEGRQTASGIFGLDAQARVPLNACSS